MGTRLVQQERYPMHKGEGVSALGLRQQNCCCLGRGWVFQVTSFPTVAGAMARIYCPRKRMRWGGVRLAGQRGVRRRGEGGMAACRL